MALILFIDTALAEASVGLGKADSLVAVKTNTDQKKHASFVQPAIEQLVEENGSLLHAIEAVAVVNGPGSYTGLRVGLASAKGLCYALDKPLILLSTLEVMAAASIAQADTDDYLHSPLIDARRMEVFTAIYNSHLQPVMSPQPMILGEDSFIDFLYNKKIVFSGNGQAKAATVVTHSNAVFSEKNYSPADINNLAQKSFLSKKFADLAYCEPFYLKNFYTL